MIEPTGKSFLCYRRCRLSEAQFLIEHQHDLGIPTWHDIKNLNEEPTEDFVRSILKDPQTSNAVMWLTPEVASSPFIHRVEAPLIFERYRNEDGFFVVPIAAGGLDYQGAAEALRDACTIEDLQQWNIRKVESNPANESEIHLIARRILARRLEAIQQYLSPEDPLKLGLYTRSNPPSDHSIPLIVDWTHRFEDRVATAETWQRYLLPALDGISELIPEKVPGRAIRASGLLSIPAATALGYYFMATKGIELSWEQYTPGRSSQEWTLQDSREDSGLIVGCNSGSTDADDLAVLVSVNADVSKAVSNSGEFLPKFRALAHVKPGNASESGNIKLDSSGEAVDVAHLVIEAARSARQNYDVRGQVHLFMAVPVGLAVLIGQLLNTLGPVQTYEHIPDSATGHYRAAALLGDRLDHNAERSPMSASQHTNKP